MALESPYKGTAGPKWLETTEGLVEKHPILGQQQLVIDALFKAWDALWSTTIGSSDFSVPMRDLAPDQRVIEGLFQNVLSRIIATGDTWRCGSAEEKSLVFIGDGAEDGELDVQIRASNADGGKFVGDKSFVAVKGESNPKGSGYSICASYSGETIYQVRVGWTDADDWKSQKTPQGQMAVLKDHVYEYKLMPVVDSYYLEAPLGTLNGLGEKSVTALCGADLNDLEDLIQLFAHSIQELTPNTLPEAKHMKKALGDVGVAARLATTISKSLSKSDYFEQAWKMAIDPTV